MRKLIWGSLFVVVLLLLGATQYYNQPNVRALGNRGFVTTYHSVNDPINDAQYVTITNIDGMIIVEIIVGPGPENVLVLKNDEAKDYLRTLGIDW